MSMGFSRDSIRRWNRDGLIKSFKNERGKYLIDFDEYNRFKKASEMYKVSDLVPCYKDKRHIRIRDLCRNGRISCIKFMGNYLLDERGYSDAQIIISHRTIREASVELGIEYHTLKTAIRSTIRPKYVGGMAYISNSEFELLKSYYKAKTIKEYCEHKGLNYKIVKLMIANGELATVTLGKRLKIKDS